MPTSRGSSHEPPKSSASPRLAKISVKRARSEATIEVAAEREVAPGAGGHAVDRRDRRLRELVQPQRGPPDHAHRRHRRARRRSERRRRPPSVRSAPEQKRVAGAGDHEHPVVATRRDLVEDLDEAPPHLAGDRVLRSGRSSVSVTTPSARVDEQAVQCSYHLALGRVDRLVVRGGTVTARMSAHGWTEPDGGVDVRHVQPYQAEKTVPLPGLRPRDPARRRPRGRRARRRTRDRRHWHTGCWHQASRPRKPQTKPRKR